MKPLNYLENIPHSETKYLRRNLLIVNFQGDFVLKMCFYFPKYIKNPKQFQENFSVALLEVLELYHFPWYVSIQNQELWVVLKHFDKTHSNKKAWSISNIIYQTFKKLRDDEKNEKENNLSSNPDDDNDDNSGFFPEDASKS